MTGTGRAVRPRIGVLVSHDTLVNLTERAAARMDQAAVVATGGEVPQIPRSRRG